MITIRQAKEDDVEDLLSIYNNIILETTAIFEYQPHTLAMRQAWFAAKKKDGYPVFIAEENEKIMGFSSYGPFRAWPAYKYSVENSVYVDKEYRGRGIGKLLIPPLINAAIQRDMHVIVASIEATNASSLRLHESFGFEEVAHFKQVGFKFGRWLDLKFLQLTLATPAEPKED
ncbi:MAG TPA: GNAT family N-acetyltransferase [Puia sp.]|nr:GNAT family N-acetyltransferase [Puia sp.]